MNKRKFLQALMATGVASGGVVLVAQRLLRPDSPPAPATGPIPVAAIDPAPELLASNPQEEFELVMLQILVCVSQQATAGVPQRTSGVRSSVLWA